MSSRTDALTPRTGHTLVVGIVARISGCQNQKELSLEDQLDHGKQVAVDLYDGPIEYVTISTKGKGERLDRPELADIDDLLRSRRLDLLICEDLGRLVRGAEATRLCGIAVDHGTRVIAPNHCIDTAEPTWEEDVIAACRDHVGHNAHTSKRLKFKLMNRFVKQGGATACAIFGYIKPNGAKTYDDWLLDPDAKRVYQELFERLQRNPNCSAAADWLNQHSVPTGEYARRTTWDGKMVRRIIRNPILKGTPGRGFRRTVKHHETGRRISVKSSDEPKYYPTPHLAAVEAAIWEEVNVLLEQRNRNLGRKPVNGHDPLWRVPRTRSRFPGQLARCWYCGRLCVWGGNGMTGNLMCPGARGYLCWNSTGFDGRRLTELIMAAITDELYRLDGFDDQLRSLVEQALTADGEVERELAELGQERDRLQREQQNLANAIAGCGPEPLLVNKLKTLKAAAADLDRRQRQAEKRAGRRPSLPATAAELRRLFEEQFSKLATSSYEFADRLRAVVPEIHVYLVRLADGGHPLPRARVTLDLSGLAPDVAAALALRQALTRVLTFDVFSPPQRERIRVDAARLAAEGVGQREIARRLTEQPKPAAVDRALALDRLIREQQRDSAYQIVHAPPENYPKLRRHRSPKYRFEPLAGYTPPSV